MALVKVFLPTYKRNISLKRSVESLIAQTFGDWICEVHNDDPTDEFPQRYISSLNDSRFLSFQHESNFGPIKTFNLMYQPTEVKYVSLLEDDNWWEPTFLEEMVKLMDRNPTVQMSWSNMRIWQESADNLLNYTGKCIWTEEVDSNFSFYSFGEFRQAFTAIHSNGAMLVRNSNLQNLITPEFIRFDFVEAVRERVLDYPIILNNKPLANFTLTTVTNRKSEIKGLHEHYMLLIASFFNRINPTKEIANSIWEDVRKSKVKSTNKLIYAGLFDSNCRELLKNAKLGDWLFFIAYNLKYPIIFFRCMCAKTIYKDLWLYLSKNKEKRFNK